MLWIDYALLALLGISAVISLTRGFVHELLSLVAWIAAFLVAGYAYPYLTPHLAAIQPPLLRNGVAIVGLVVVTLLVAGLVNTLLGRLIACAGLTTLDRLLGVFFGLLRGALVCCALLFLWDEFFSGSQHPVWQQSQLIPYFDKFTQWFFFSLKKCEWFNAQ